MEEWGIIFQWKCVCDSLLVSSSISSAIYMESPESGSSLLHIITSSLFYNMHQESTRHFCSRKNHRKEHGQKPKQNKVTTTTSCLSVCIKLICLFVWRRFNVEKWSNISHSKGVYAFRYAHKCHTCSMAVTQRRINMRAALKELIIR